MPAYDVSDLVRPTITDQVFSTYLKGEVAHINSSALMRMRDRYPEFFKKITIGLSPEIFDMVILHRGIEEPKVKALSPKQLREAGISIFTDDGDHHIIDGHHRLVKRWRAGLRTMDFYVTVPQIWETARIHLTAEGDEKFRSEIPELKGQPTLPTAVLFNT